MEQAGCRNRGGSISSPDTFSEEGNASDRGFLYHRQNDTGGVRGGCGTAVGGTGRGFRRRGRLGRRYKGI